MWARASSFSNSRFGGIISIKGHLSGRWSYFSNIRQEYLEFELPELFLPVSSYVALTLALPDSAAYLETVMCC